MKKCLVCKKEFKERHKIQKYCGYICSYKAMDKKARDRYKNKIGLVKSKCICCNGKGYVYQNYTNTQQETMKEILFLYKKGMGIREIQRKLKIKSPFTVVYYLRMVNRKFTPKLKII